MTQKPKRSFAQHAGLFLGVALLLGGTYVLSIMLAPQLPAFVMQPIDKKVLATTKPTENKIIIPKINVNIAYGEGLAALDSGAQWRHPERGNPEKGGNFIVAAHRFTIQPTPWQTVEKSPFYHIDKLVVGDQIIVDYNAKRYGYEISELRNVTPHQVEIEAPSDTPKLTLYSCDLGGAAAGRVVVIASPIGEVALQVD